MAIYLLLLCVCSVRPVIERLLVRGSLLSNSMTSNDGMASSALEMTLCRRAIKIWVVCHDMDGTLYNLMQIKLRADIGRFRIPTRGMPIR